MFTGGNHEKATEMETAFTPFTFGCQESVQGLENLQIADGIMGMGRATSSYWEQWAKAQGDNPRRYRQFSLCFTLNDMHDRSGSGAGAMVLGGQDPRLNRNKMVYAQLIHHEDKFVVWIERIYVRHKGGHSVVDSDPTNSVVSQVPAKPVDINRGDVILDSGSTGFLLSSELEEAFRSAWRRAVGARYEADIPAKYRNFDELPTILMQFSPRDKSKSMDPNQPGLAGHDQLDPNNKLSVIVALSPHHYMRHIPESDKYASQFLFNKAEGEYQVLGAYLFAEHNVHFDIPNERIGFAESDCNFWNIGNGNFDHMPHDGDTPPPPPPFVEDDNAIYSSIRSREGDSWECGSISCRSAGILLGVMGFLLGACYCFRAYAEASTDRRGRRRVTFADQPETQFRDEPENYEYGDEQGEESALDQSVEMAQMPSYRDSEMIEKAAMA